MEMIFNQVLDPKSDWSNIKFVFPNRFSMSYMIEEYRLVKDGPNFELKVKSITFSPRLSSQKGAFEDVVGIILEREQGV